MKTLYVSILDGDDSWTGAKAHSNTSGTGPFKTIQKARDIAAVTPLEYTKIIIREGTYTFTTPFILTSSNSGSTPFTPLTFQAYDNEIVKLCAATTLDSTLFSLVTAVSDSAIYNRLNTSAKGKVYVYNLGSGINVGNFTTYWCGAWLNQADQLTNTYNEYLLSSKYIKGSDLPPLPEISIDGELLTLARWPSTGYAEMKSVIEAGSSGGSDCDCVGDATTTCVGKTPCYDSTSDLCNYKYYTGTNSYLKNRIPKVPWGIDGIFEYDSSYDSIIAKWPNPSTYEMYIYGPISFDFSAEGMKILEINKTNRTIKVNSHRSKYGIVQFNESCYGRAYSTSSQTCTCKNSSGAETIPGYTQPVYDSTPCVATSSKQESNDNLATRKLSSSPQRWRQEYWSDPHPRRWFALNILEELNSAGQYYIDRATKKLYVWSKTPITSSSKVLISKVSGYASDNTQTAYESDRSQSVIKITGASNIKFENIEICDTSGHGIDIIRSNNITLKNCDIHNTRKTGIRILGGTSNNVDGCNIFDTGTGGVRLSGGNKITLEPSKHIIQNCDITRTCLNIRGETMVAAIQMHGVGNTIRKNKIYNLSSQAIGHSGNNNIIEYNNIHDVILECDDCGAIYTWANISNRGNICRYNLFRNIQNKLRAVPQFPSANANSCNSNPTSVDPNGDSNAMKDGWFGHCAIYFDNFATGMTITGNIFYRCGNKNGKASMGAIFTNYGIDVIASNNIFVDCPLAVGSNPNRAYYATDTTATINDRQISTGGNESWEVALNDKPSQYNDSSAAPCCRTPTPGNFNGWSVLLNWNGITLGTANDVAFIQNPKLFEYNYKELGYVSQCDIRSTVYTNQYPELLGSKSTTPTSFLYFDTTELKLKVNANYPRKNYADRNVFVQTPYKTSTYSSWNQVIKTWDTTNDQVITKIEDAGFIDILAGDFSLSPNSPILSNTLFDPIPVQNIAGYYEETVVANEVTVNIADLPIYQDRQDCGFIDINDYTRVFNTSSIKPESKYLKSHPKTKKHIFLTIPWSVEGWDVNGDIVPYRSDNPYYTTEVRLSNLRTRVDLTKTVENILKTGAAEYNTYITNLNNDTVGGTQPVTEHMGEVPLLTYNIEYPCVFSVLSDTNTRQWADNKYGTGTWQFCIDFLSNVIPKSKELLADPVFRAANNIPNVFTKAKIGYYALPHGCFGISYCEPRTTSDVYDCSRTVAGGKYLGFHEQPDSVLQAHRNMLMSDEYFGKIMRSGDWFCPPVYLYLPDQDGTNENPANCTTDIREYIFRKNKYGRNWQDESHYQNVLIFKEFNSKEGVEKDIYPMLGHVYLGGSYFESKCANAAYDQTNPSKLFWTGRKTTPEDVQKIMEIAIQAGNHSIKGFTYWSSHYARSIQTGLVDRYCDNYYKYHSRAIYARDIDPTKFPFILNDAYWPTKTCLTNTTTTNIFDPNIPASNTSYDNFIISNIVSDSSQSNFATQVKRNSNTLSSFFRNPLDNTTSTQAQTDDQGDTIVPLTPSVVLNKTVSDFNDQIDIYRTDTISSLVPTTTEDCVTIAGELCSWNNDTCWKNYCFGECTCANSQSTGDSSGCNAVANWPCCRCSQFRGAGNRCTYPATHKKTTPYVWPDDGAYLCRNISTNVLKLCIGACNTGNCVGYTQEVEEDVGKVTSDPTYGNIIEPRMCSSLKYFEGTTPMEPYVTQIDPALIGELLTCEIIKIYDGNVNYGKFCGGVADGTDTDPTDNVYKDFCYYSHGDYPVNIQKDTISYDCLMMGCGCPDSKDIVPCQNPEITPNCSCGTTVAYIDNTGLERYCNDPIVCAMPDPLIVNWQCNTPQYSGPGEIRDCCACEWTGACYPNGDCSKYFDCKAGTGLYTTGAACSPESCDCGTSPCVLSGCYNGAPTTHAQYLDCMSNPGCTCKTCCVDPCVTLGCVGKDYWACKATSGCNGAGCCAKNCDVDCGTAPCVVVNKIEIVKKPRGMVVVGNYLYVAGIHPTLIPDRGAVSVIDLRTRTVVATKFPSPSGQQSTKLGALIAIAHFPPQNRIIAVGPDGALEFDASQPLGSAAGCSNCTIPTGVDIAYNPDNQLLYIISKSFQEMGSIDNVYYTYGVGGVRTNRTVPGMTELCHFTYLPAVGANASKIVGVGTSTGSLRAKFHIDNTTFAVTGPVTSGASWGGITYVPPANAFYYSFGSDSVQVNKNIIYVGTADYTSGGWSLYGALNLSINTSNPSISRPAQMAYCSSNGKVYVSDFGGVNKITIINPSSTLASTTESTTKIDLAAGTRNIIYDATSNRIFATGTTLTNKNYLFIIDPVTNALDTVNSSLPIECGQSGSEGCCGCADPACVFDTVTHYNTCVTTAACSGCCTNPCDNITTMSFWPIDTVAKYDQCIASPYGTTECCGLFNCSYCGTAGKGRCDNTDIRCTNPSSKDSDCCVCNNTDGNCLTNTAALFSNCKSNCSAPTCCVDPCPADSSITTLAQYNTCISTYGSIGCLCGGMKCSYCGTSPYCGTPSDTKCTNSASPNTDCCICNNSTCATDTIVDYDKCRGKSAAPTCPDTSCCIDPCRINGSSAISQITTVALYDQCIAKTGIFTGLKDNACCGTFQCSYCGATVCSSTDVRCKNTASPNSDCCICNNTTCATSTASEYITCLSSCASSACCTNPCGGAPTNYFDCIESTYFAKGCCAGAPVCADCLGVTCASTRSFCSNSQDIGGCCACKNAACATANKTQYDICKTNSNCTNNSCCVNPCIGAPTNYFDCIGSTYFAKGCCASAPVCSDCGSSPCTSPHSFCSNSEDTGGCCACKNAVCATATKTQYETCKNTINCTNNSCCVNPCIGAPTNYFDCIGSTYFAKGCCSFSCADCGSSPCTSTHTECSVGCCTCADPVCASSTKTQYDNCVKNVNCTNASCCVNPCIGAPTNYFDCIVSPYLATGCCAPFTCADCGSSPCTSTRGQCALAPDQNGCCACAFEVCSTSTKAQYDICKISVPCINASCCVDPCINMPPITTVEQWRQCKAAETGTSNVYKPYIDVGCSCGSFTCSLCGSSPCSNSDALCQATTCCTCNKTECATSTKVLYNACRLNPSCLAAGCCINPCAGAPKDWESCSRSLYAKKGCCHKPTGICDTCPYCADGCTTQALYDQCLSSYSCSTHNCCHPSFITIPPCETCPNDCNACNANATCVANGCCAGYTCSSITCPDSSTLSGFQNCISNGCCKNLGCCSNPCTGCPSDYRTCIKNAACNNAGCCSVCPGGVDGCCDLCSEDRLTCWKTCGVTGKAGCCPGGPCDGCLNPLDGSTWYSCITNPDCVDLACCGTAPCILNNCFSSTKAEYLACINSSACNPPIQDPLHPCCSDPCDTCPTNYFECVASSTCLLAGCCPSAPSCSDCGTDPCNYSDPRCSNGEDNATKGCCVCKNAVCATATKTQYDICRNNTNCTNNSCCVNPCIGAPTNYFDCIVSPYFAKGCCAAAPVCSDCINPCGHVDPRCSNATDHPTVKGCCRCKDARCADSTRSQYLNCTNKTNGSYCAGCCDNPCTGCGGYKISEYNTCIAQPNCHAKGCCNAPALNPCSGCSTNPNCSNDAICVKGNCCRNTPPCELCSAEYTACSSNNTCRLSGCCPPNPCDSCNRLKTIEGYDECSADDICMAYNCCNDPCESCKNMYYTECLTDVYCQEMNCCPSEPCPTCPEDYQQCISNEICRLYCCCKDV